MAKKQVKSSSNISLRADASFVHSVMYLVRDKSRLRNSIALFFGLLLGGIYPVVSYVICHLALPHAINEGNYWKIFIYSVIGISGLWVSLNNVQDQIRQMTRSTGKLPWAYAILLEGAAMFLNGNPIELTVGGIALASVIICNTVKMTYTSLLPKQKM